MGAPDLVPQLGVHRGAGSVDLLPIKRYVVHLVSVVVGVAAPHAWVILPLSCTQVGLGG